MQTLETPGIETFTIAIVVFFVGAGLNRLIKPLGRWNIPEAVTGGLVASLATLALFEGFGLKVVFDLDARDTLLLYFFTGIGLNAKFDDLVAGGRPLMRLLALTLAFLVIQNLIAAGGATMLGLPSGVTALLGSAALIGGHGTTIAWAPMIEQRFGLKHAMEIGVASATLGLVAASLVGGPTAKFLITRYGLAGGRGAPPILGLPDASGKDDIDHVALMGALLVLSVAILIGLRRPPGPRRPRIEVAAVRRLPSDRDRPHQHDSAPRPGTPVAVAHALARACLRLLAQRLSGHVADEHAAVVGRRARADPDRRARPANDRRRRLRRPRRLSRHGRGL